MKKIFFVFFIIMIFIFSFSEVYRERISKNLELLYKYVPENDISSVSIFIEGGSANYGYEKSGIENIIFRMIEKCGKNYSETEMNELMDKYFVNVSYDNSYDYSSFTFSTLNKYLFDVTKIFADNLKEPDFSETVLEKERNRMIDEIKSKEEDPDELLYLKLNEYFFKNHPYISNPEGYVETVQNLKEQDLYNHLKKILSNRRVVISVVSGVPFKDSEEFFKREFGFINGKFEKIKGVKEFDLCKGDTILKYEKGGLQTKYLGCKFKIPSVKDKEYLPVRVGLSILSKRVYETLRTKHGLTYAAYVGASNKLVNYGVFYVSTLYPDSAIKLYRDEIEKVRKEGIKQEEIDDMKNIYQTSFFLDNERTSNRSFALGYNYLIFGDYDYDMKFIKELDNLKSDKVTKTLLKYLKDFKFILLE
ncbi:MAG: pitrilysin family protein [candidate division WOR-3 bacterium]